MVSEFENATEEAGGEIRTGRKYRRQPLCEVIGERWSLLVLRELFYGVHRFDRIVERTGAPRNILSTRLRHLEDEGVLDAPALPGGAGRVTNTT